MSTSQIGNRPQQLNSNETPQQINILVDKRDGEQTKAVFAPQQMFQASCLFNPGNLSSSDKSPKNSQPTRQILKTDIVDNAMNQSPIQPIIGGFSSGIGNHKMAPILEDNSQQKEVSSACVSDIVAHQGIRSQIQGVTLIDKIDWISQNENGQRRKSIPKPSLDLDRVINQYQQATEAKVTSTRSSAGGKSKDAPPMSSRRMNQLMQSQQELAIEAKILEICSSSVIQPVFQAIWKVILTMCYEKRVLHKYMKKNNLQSVPIRTLHFNEILCLFRKAHGPILQIKKVDKNASMKSNKQKKASLVTANETVQGFSDYNTFCKSLVRMLGDGVLLLKPNLYTVVVQLVFEAVSIQTMTKRKEPVIYLRRITDIMSPFQTPITDNLPVNRIFTLETLDQIVKHFCMKEILQKELERLAERKFIPSALINKDAKVAQQAGEQLYDSIELMLKYSHYQKIRLEKISRFEATTPQSTVKSDQRGLSTLKKITHAGKQKRIIAALPDNSKMQMMESESIGPCLSEQTSDDGRYHEQEQYSSLQPKLPYNSRDRETPIMINAMFQLDRQPFSKIEAVQPLGPNSMQFHIKFGETVPRTPQEGQRRLRITEKDTSRDMFRVSQLSITEQHTELGAASASGREDQFSFQGGRALTSKNEGPKGEVERRDIVASRMSNPIMVQGASFDQHYKEMPLTLMDAMHKDHKISKLSEKTKQLREADDIQKLQQFAVHRNRFDKLRNKNMEDTRSASLNDASSNVDTFHIQINSKGKLDEVLGIEIAPIKEMQQELYDDVETKPNSDGKKDLLEEMKSEAGKAVQSEQKKHDAQSLFDFKPLLIQGAILCTQDSINKSVSDMEGQTARSMENLCDLTFKQEEQRANQTKDYLNISKTFNCKNLQTARLKNKRVIADNVREQNKLLKQKGYNTQQLKGRHLGQPKTNHSRRRKSQAATKILIPESSIDKNEMYHGASTERRTTRSINTQRTYNRVQPKDKIYQTFGEETLPSDSTSPPTGNETPLLSNKLEGVTLESYIMSLEITKRPGRASSKPVSRGAAVGGVWGRRGTIPVNPTSRMGVTSHSQRPRLRSIGSPDPESQKLRRTGTLTTDQDLGDAMFCKTIPTIVKEYQTRIQEKGVGTIDDIYHSYKQQQQPDNSNAIPIHLHVVQASMNRRDHSSPISQHGEMRDSLTAPSRDSRVPEPVMHKMSQGQDDTICTVRAESNLDKGALENALKQANLSQNLQQQADRIKTGAKTAKIVLVAPKTRLQSQGLDFQLPQPIMYKQYTQPASSPRIASQQCSPIAQDCTQGRITGNNLKVYTMNQVSEANTSGIISTVPSQINMKQFHQMGGGVVVGNQLADFSVGVGRTRTVSTADHQCRKKVTNAFAHRLLKAQQQYRSEAQPEDLGQVTENSATHIESLLAEGRKIDDEISLIDPVSATRKNMNFDDVGRIQASLETRGLNLNNSDKSGFQSIQTPAQPTQESAEAISSVNYTRQKPRGASDIDYSCLSQPQTLIHSAVVDLSRRIAIQNPPNQHEQLFQKGEFIAPRRAMTRNRQRLNIQTPINLLALHDHKNMKNLNFTSCNKDLFTSKYETDTLNLSPGTRSPGGRGKKRHNSVYEVKAGRLMNANVRKRNSIKADTLPLRQPTPIKIVDLSARPCPLVRRKHSIQQEYMQQFPLLKNPKRPLMQDVLRQLNGGSPIREKSDAKTIFRRPPQEMNKEATHSTTTKISHQSSAAIDLRSMVGYLVRAPNLVPLNGVLSAPVSQRSYYY